MTDKRFDGLDNIALHCKDGETSSFDVLSTGEQIYVALAANKPELITGYTVTEAINRLGPVWLSTLIQRHG